MNLIDKNINTINELCDKDKVKDLYIFGSLLTNKFNESSDIDLLIQSARRFYRVQPAA